MSEKKISVIATNLETGIEHVIPGKIQKPGAVTAPAKQLSQLIQSLSDETITLEARQHQLALHTPTSDITLLGLNPNDFPTLPVIKQEHSFSVPATLFLNALQRVVPAAATTTFKPELSGVLMVAGPNGLVLAATDSFRLAEKTIAESGGLEDTAECIVPLRTVQEVLRTAPEDAEVRVSVGEHQAVFSWNETRILSRLIDGSYPPYKNIIPAGYETTLTVNREELLRKIRLAGVFSSRLNDVTLRFSPTELEVITTNTETGGTTSRLSVKGRGASGSVMFNHHYLSDGVEAAGGANVVLHLNGVSGPALIQNPGDASYFYLLMPIRSV